MIAAGLALAVAADSATVVVPGFLFAAGGHGSGVGAEVSISHWPDRKRLLAIGVFGQALAYSGPSRFSAGAQASFGPCGVELGWARRGADGDHRATHGVQLTPFLTIGVLNLGVRWTTFVGPAPRWPSELAFVLSLKTWFPYDTVDPVPVPFARLPSGRPLRDALGREVQAPIARGSATFAKASAAWLRVARLEQASVAAFVRLLRELALHGAPEDLLARCRDAALDEIAHARATFALAARHGGVAPGDLAIPPPRAVTLEALAVESLLDGCYGEALSASAARRAARATGDAHERAVLARIAREERTHAALGWAIVAFCLERGGEAVARALADTSLPRTALGLRVAARRARLLRTWADRAERADRPRSCSCRRSLRRSRRSRATRTR